MLYSLLTGPIGIDADNFMDVLDTGVVLCKLASLIVHKAEAACSSDKSLQVYPSSKQVSKIIYAQHLKQKSDFSKCNRNSKQDVRGQWPIRYATCIRAILRLHSPVEIS